MAMATAKNAAVGSPKIADVFLRRGALRPDDLKEAQEKARAASVRLEKYLLDNQLVPAAEVTLCLAEYLRMAPIALANFNVNPKLLDTLPMDVLQKHIALPLIKVGGTLVVALGDPFNIVAVDELHALTGLNVVPLVAAEKEVQDQLARLAAPLEQAPGMELDDIMRETDSEVEIGHEEKNDVSLEEMMESAEGAPVIRMVNMILVEALRTRASDIHIEPQEKTVRLRYRIDGSLVERPSPSKAYQNAIISRIKIMSELDIAERRVPQDGRCRIKALGKEVDIRVSVLPSFYGEKIVMRMLDKSGLFPNLAAMDLDPVAYNGMSHALAQPQGIILVTGPTGSGKTFTLYSCLLQLNSPDVNIVTCEDPVEYQLPGLTQVQINADVGLSFADALRSILRQDPDICLVGEIRDAETAQIAVKAALTGHLVLSTLHTNDAAGAVARLMDMGIPPFLLASSMILAQAQRLCKRLCPNCKEAIPLPVDVLKGNGFDPEFFRRTPADPPPPDGFPASEFVPIYKPAGCPKCNGKGYKGRKALMEVMVVDNELKQLIMRGANTIEIKQLARQKGMVTLKEAGMAKVRDGTTSLDASLEITGSE